jgi:hypothetical protein
MHGSVSKYQITLKRPAKPPAATGPRRPCGRASDVTRIVPRTRAPASHRCRGRRRAGVSHLEVPRSDWRRVR